MAAYTLHLISIIAKRATTLFSTNMSSIIKRKNKKENCHEENCYLRKLKEI